MKTMEIVGRIRKAYEPDGVGMDYHALMRAVFPADQYPKAYNYCSNGGPPGCTMAFNYAIRKMAGSIYHSGNGKRSVWLPLKT